LKLTNCASIFGFRNSARAFTMRRAVKFRHADDELRIAREDLNAAFEAFYPSARCMAPAHSMTKALCNGIVFSMGQRSYTAQTGDNAMQFWNDGLMRRLGWRAAKFSRLPQIHCCLQ